MTKSGVIGLILATLGTAGCILLYNPAMESRALLKTELAATPTPTPNTRSMLWVTEDASVTPAPTAFLLKNGSRGDAVKTVQKRLKELGYYSGECDGQYGSATAEAVKAFQTQNGLTADGMVGATTRDALNAPDAPRFVPTPTPAPEASLLKKGDSGEQVRKMQQRLTDLGYYSGAVDGEFGSGTQQAVKLFQRQNGLEADGIAAAKTFTALYADDAKRVTVTPTPAPDEMPILVNKTHPVADDYQPGSLVMLSSKMPKGLCKLKGSEIEGEATAVEALIAMLKAAEADGVTGWQINAGYRSYSYQKKLFNNSVKEYMDKGFSRSRAESATRQTVADPGTSEHHTGLAFDLSVPGASQFSGTTQQKWLHKYCWDYGFIVRYTEEKEKITGYLAECWHIRYVGLPHSQTMYDKNQCLEEYLGILD